LSAYYRTRRYIAVFTNPTTRSHTQPDQSSLRSCKTYLLKIHFNNIHPSPPRSFKSSLHFRFPHQIPLCTSPLPHTCRMLRPANFSWFDHPNNIWRAVQIKQSPPTLVTSSLKGPDILLRTPFTKTLSLCSSM